MVVKIWRRPAVVLSALSASCLLLGFMVAPSQAAEPMPADPVSDTSFFSYDANAPLASFAPGEVLKTRVITYHVAGIPTLVKAAQIVYRTTDQRGRPAANVTSVLLPPAGTATKAVSYQSFYDSNSIDDAPSRSIAGNQTLGGLLPAAESAALTSLLGAGIAVIIPDDQGADSAFGMGRQYGQVTLDSMRAALRANQVTGLTPTAKIGLLGYSGGAIATGWAAQLQPTYAPELSSNLVGAAYGGITVAPAHNISYVADTPMWAVIIPTALVGAIKAYDIDFDRYVSDYGRQLLERAEGKSIAFNFGFSSGASWQKMVKPEYANPNSVPEYVRIVNDNNMGLAGAPRMPVLMGQGGGGIFNGTPPSAKYGPGDGVMLINDARTLARGFCAENTKVLFREYPWLEHGGAAGALVGEAVPWLLDRLNSKPAPSNCSTIRPGNSLAAEHLEPAAPR